MTYQPGGPTRPAIGQKYGMINGRITAQMYCRVSNNTRPFVEIEQKIRDKQISRVKHVIGANNFSKSLKF